MWGIDHHGIPIDFRRKKALLCAAVCAEVPRVITNGTWLSFDGFSNWLSIYWTSWGPRVWSLKHLHGTCRTWHKWAPFSALMFFGQNFLWDWRIPVSLGDSASLLPSTYGMYASAVWHTSTVAVIGWAALHMTCRQHLPPSYAHPWKIAALKNGDRNPCAPSKFQVTPVTSA